MIVADKVFRDYAVHMGAQYLKNVPPVLKTGKAHRYREAIGEESGGPPNFAGHFKIVRIGRGAATSCLAIVDTTDGYVYFPSELDSIEALLFGTSPSSRIGAVLRGWVTKNQ
jgi:hypothetical protein